MWFPFEKYFVYGGSGGNGHTMVFLESFLSYTFMSPGDETLYIGLTQEAFYMLSHLGEVHNDFLYSL